MTTTTAPGPQPFLAGQRALLVGLAVLAVVSVATALGGLQLVAALAAGALVLAIVRDPRVYLFAYVILIPFDGSGSLANAATLSRFAGLAFALTYLIQRRGSLRVDLMGIFGWAFVAFASLSILWSIDRSTSVPEVLTLVQLFVISLMIADMISEHPDIARPLALVYAGSATAIGLVGIITWLTARSTLIAGRAEAFEGQDPAQFTAILVPAFFVFAWVSLRRPRPIPIIGTAICTVAIIVSGTRSAWIAVAIVLAVVLVPRLSRRGIATFAVAAVVGGLFLLVIPGTSDLIIDRLDTAVSSGGTGRTDIWTIALHVWGNSPIAGVGYGAFPAAITPEAIRAVNLPTADTGFLTPPVGSHSILFGTLIELGVIGVLLLAGFFWTVLRPGQGGGDIAEVARMVVLAMLLQAFFLDVLGRKQVWLFVAIALGLAAAQAAARARGREAELPVLEGPPRRRPVIRGPARPPDLLPGPVHGG
ncbi:MAG TPA: O-antigen ligase family protein [Candidatus Limnocylindrales bacterium]